MRKFDAFSNKKNVNLLFFNIGFRCENICIALKNFKLTNKINNYDISEANALIDYLYDDSNYELSVLSALKGYRHNHLSKEYLLPMVNTCDNIDSLYEFFNIIAEDCLFYIEENYYEE